ncbi:hypothetical protein H1230_10770 [Paenibacillus sp. 19GGS1-52]|uniref:hypothetical protein n=1 Tax=Paenibacillus sp. 19GGS1-52 TaxID=2758563 RepID=UPI001EFA2CD7|nr:hypothetical protein [Paenibacillus sp. 19GGS1-52]ULO09205.1 hypothetical protein H1230_10770 [Paenibacillus sp. 19GGS1-52]
MKEESELKNDISATVHKIVVLMRKDSKIPKEQILVLINHLEEFRKFSKGQEVISKRLAYELFYLYTNITSLISYNEDKDISIITELYMVISSVFNDFLYQ